MKRISAADRRLRAGWSGKRREFRGRDLFGKTVGIVGLGHIGTRVAEILTSAFRCPVIAYDPFLTAQQAERRHATLVDFNDLCQRADIITIHTPLTPETHRLFDASAFAMMKPGAVFISAARGSIHDEQALADAIERGHIDGAGLDVWEREPPPPDHPLMQFPNVVTSPHIAGATEDSLERMAEYAASQLLILFDGKPPLRPVNPQILNRFYQRYADILG